MYIAGPSDVDNRATQAPRSSRVRASWRCSRVSMVDLRLVWVLAAITTHDVPADRGNTVHSNGFNSPEHGRDHEKVRKRK
jgi:hypothetical protein